MPEGTIGELLFRLRADPTGLAGEIEAQTKKASAGASVKVAVTPTLAAADIDRLRKVAEGKGIKIPADFDFGAAEKRVQERLVRLRGQAGLRISVDADTKTADEKLAALKTKRLDALNKGIKAITIDADITKAEQKLKRLETDAERTANRVKGSFGAGISAGFERSLDNIQARLGPFGAALDGPVSSLKALGPVATGAGLGLVALGFAAKASVGEFTNLAASVAAFKRTTGASAQDSSRLVAALDDIGISAQQAAPALAILARNADSKAFAATGVALARTRTGAVDLVGTLANVIAKAEGITDPIQRANLVTAALGRNAAVLGPLFDRGAEGFRKLLTSNEGQVLTDADLQKARDYKAALDHLGDTVKDLEIKFGRLLVPALTATAQGLSRGIDLASKAGLGFRLLKEDVEHLGAVTFDRVTGSLQKLVDAADKAAGPFLNFPDNILDKQVVEPAKRATTALEALTGSAVGVVTTGSRATGDFSVRMGAVTSATNAFDTALKTLPSSIGNALTPLSRLGTNTTELATATGTYTDALDKLRDGLGLTVSAQAADLQAKLNASKAAKALTDGQAAITRARQNEADVAKSSSASIVAAEQRINDVRSKGPGLQRAVVSAQRDQAAAAVALTTATAAETRAQENYDRVMGLLPPKIADVTDALNAQLGARNALADLSDDSAELQDQLAKAQAALDQLNTSGQSAANDRAESLRLAAADAAKAQKAAEDALARAKAGESDTTVQIRKDLADPTIDLKRRAELERQLADEQAKVLASVPGLVDDVTRAQIASRDAQRELNDRLADTVDITDDVAAANRRVEQIKRRIAALDAQAIPDAKKALDAAQRLADEVQSGAGFSPDSLAGEAARLGRPRSDRENEAKAALAVATRGRVAAEETVQTAQQTTADRVADITKNEGDLQQAIKDRGAADETARKNRGAAHLEVLNAIAAEKTAQQQAHIDRLAALGAEETKAKGVAKDTKTATDALVAVLAAGGKAPDLTAFTTIRGALLSIGDAEVLATLDKAFAKAGGTTPTGGPATPAPVALPANRTFGPPAPTTIVNATVTVTATATAAQLGASVGSGIFDALQELANRNGGVLLGERRH